MTVDFRMPNNEKVSCFDAYFLFALNVAAPPPNTPMMDWANNKTLFFFSCFPFRLYISFQFLSLLKARICLACALKFINHFFCISMLSNRRSLFSGFFSSSSSFIPMRVWEWAKVKSRASYRYQVSKIIKKKKLIKNIFHFVWFICFVCKIGVCFNHSVIFRLNQSKY